MNREIIRYDRKGKPEYRKSPQTIKALAILQAAIDRAAEKDRVAFKARQNAGELTLDERLFKAIFGEIK